MEGEVVSGRWNPLARFAPALLAVALLSLGLVSCGAVSISTQKTRPQSKDSSQRDADGDDDSNTGRRYDSDDATIIDFGRIPSPAERQTIETLLRDYYSVAASANGAAACPLVYSITTETLAEEHGQLPSRSGLPPGVCASVLSKYFQQQHGLLVRDTARLRIEQVRVGGKNAQVLVNFGGGQPRDMIVKREQGAWKVAVLFDVGIP